MIHRAITFLFFFSVTLSFAQKKVITHDDYDLWKSMSDVKISKQGKLVVSTIKTSTKMGDGYVEIYNTISGKKFTFFNGYETSISHDEKYVVFKRKPAYQKTRKEKKKKLKEANRTKDALFIYDVKNNKIHDSILNVKKYKLPKEYSGWVVIEKYKSKKKDTLIKIKSKASKQNYALVYTLNTKKKDTIYQIKDFVLSNKGKQLYYTTSSKEQPKKDNVALPRDNGIYKYNLTSGISETIDEGKYIYKKLATNDTGTELSFIAIKDSVNIEYLKYELYYFKDNQLKKIVDSSVKHLNDHWELSGQQTPFFSESGNRLYFYSRPMKQYRKDTTLLEEEIPQVDVWHWKDKMIQPEQKSKFKELNKKAFISYFDIERNAYVHLQDKDTDDLIFDKKKEQPYIFGATSSPYDVQRSWDITWKDFFVIDSKTGKKRLLLKNTALKPFLSPDYKYGLHFDINTGHWFSLDLKTLTKTNLTKEIPVAFYDEENDRPMLPRPYGFGGFDSKGYALVFDKYDIWKIALNGKEKPINITKNGRKNNVEYRTERLDSENKNNASYSNKKLVVTSFDKSTKASGVFVLEKDKLVEKIKASDFLISSFKKAKNADVFTYRKENFKTYPDLHVSKNDFTTVKKITQINPHQENFKWGTAELFSWKAYDGTPLEGIIYKPQDFDPSKKYPMITYFYEKRSDTYHKHHAPQPSASTVNAAYLVSNDYIMFVPDIVYKEGKPGPSAYNCIVSGVEAVEELGYVDSNNLAIQGQSWGGYQVAYLITVTNKFKTAMAGAPVSNMTSAYGGIRWQSGLSRAFQYEKTQSRIGKNLWEGFDLYIENSPLFGIPKIETPLLMMHNDKDGAVPYYQGIEMFMGMRRLQKPVWLLVYNDEAHNLRKVKNKKDLSIRMMQFFDHYLKDQPAPEWMNKGVPRIQKGKDFGYGLDKG
ncbi:hypothetical protein AWE51_02145 [Aquimarina aggregata]|uniref:Peptidase S9 prolyl oligopeptidase catalytic domain-containing protein n=1 Tax=Aquimarina aggregata TaxID=1642818 RepID=A0A162CU76_9FLAO|nr:prolyl oligopeptidase family serine peptidase [Aquimarina aggregata]KZS42264.1 hypothetical protein AWE51_02145 [Aquimarina aggregata]